VNKQNLYYDSNRSIVCTMNLKLLKFEAEWCAPCDQQDALLEEYDVTPVEHIDVDESHEQANRYNVRSIPTMVLVDGETPVQQWTGVTQIDEIESTVEEVR